MRSIGVEERGRFRVTTIAVAAALVAGCGGGGGGASGPGATTVSPPDGARTISVSTPVRVALAGGVDPATVTDATVALLRITDRNLSATGAARVLVRTRFAYDASSNVVTLTPISALGHGRFEVQLKGLRARDGRALPDLTTSFTTTLNLAARSGTSLFLYGADGRTLRTVVATAGSDGVWGTADDMVMSWTDHEYDSAGRLDKSVTRSTAGPDGRWNTSDDRISAYSRREYDATGNVTRIVSYDNAGPDALWFTADDTVSSYDLNRFEGSLVRTATFTARGPDNRWFTADDETAAARSYEYDEWGRLIRLVTHGGAGPDGLWMTADDVVSSYTASTYAGNRLTQSVTYGAPGADGVWFSADDGMSGYVVPTYDGNSRLARSVGYSAAGPDGRWSTADDVVSIAVVYSYDAAGRTIRLTSYSGTGADGLWFTADDDGSSTSTTYDPGGDRVQGTTCTAGPNGRLLTEDDVCTTTADYSAGDTLPAFPL